MQAATGKSRQHVAAGTAGEPVLHAAGVGKKTQILGLRESGGGEGRRDCACMGEDTGAAEGMPMGSSRGKGEASACRMVRWPAWCGAQRLKLDSPGLEEVSLSSFPSQWLKKQNERNRWDLLGDKKGKKTEAPKRQTC